jgi:hypothetical protein
MGEPSMTNRPMSRLTESGDFGFAQLPLSASLNYHFRLRSITASHNNIINQTIANMKLLTRNQVNCFTCVFKE